MTIPVQILREEKKIEVLREVTEILDGLDDDRYLREDIEDMLADLLRESERRLAELVKLEDSQEPRYIP